MSKHFTTTKLETLCLHAGLEDETPATQIPIYQSASFNFDDSDHARDLFALKKFGNIYSRLTNPTLSALQTRLALLEGGSGACVTSSGHAAQLVCLFNLLQSGDHIIVSSKLYGGSITQFSKSFKQFGWQASFVDPNDPNQVRSAIQTQTKAIFIESQSNPGGEIADIESLAEIAHQAGIPLIVDNTIATPCLCQPFKWGADIVVYSTTKFISGNGTSIGGAIIDSGKFDWSQNNKFPLLVKPDSSYHGLSFYDSFESLAFTVRSIAVGLRDLGTTLSPFNAFLTLIALESLVLRIERHVENGRKTAQYLSQHSKVKWISYSGLKDNSNHEFQKKYFPKGVNSVFTIGLKGGYEAGKKLVEKTKLFLHVANVGDSRSLILHPASTSHSQLTDEQKQAAGAGNEVIRLSIGIEHINDILTDLSQALDQV